MYQAYFCKLKNVRPHSNADRMQLAECFTNTVCVDLTAYENQCGIYFPESGQLSEEFCEYNNLVRKSDGTGGYLHPTKRNITAIKLRGERSDGLFLPLSCLEYTGFKESEFEENKPFTVIKGYEICQKYIPRTNQKSNKVKTQVVKRKEDIVPLFQRHVDTAQLAYNLDKFEAGDEIEISLKMHGTSGRTGYLPKLVGYKRTLLDRIFKRQGKPIYEYGYVTGTRRTVVTNSKGGFYGDNHFREIHAKKFEGQLHKNETVYYEIVGNLPNGKEIMGHCDNTLLKDKDFVRQYGEVTRFDYGCGRTESDIYAYRMTYTTDDGQVFEYPPHMLCRRCGEMGIKTVPVFERFFIPIDCANPGEYVFNIANEYADGPDPVGKTHIREGVVIRKVNSPVFEVYKYKNFNFKCLAGIVTVPDEASDDILAEL